MLLASSVSSAALAQSSDPDVPRQKEDLFMVVPSAHSVNVAQTSRIVSNSAASHSDEWARTVYENTISGFDEDVFYVRPGTGDRIPLAYSLANEIEPRFNRDATTVAFATDRDGNFEIYRVNIDNSDLRRLTTHPAADREPVWSPNGTRIAFVSQRDTNWNIYVMNADGSNVTRLTSDSADNIMPAWSPDGTSIAWVRRVQISQTSFERRLWVMQANGANPHALTGALPFLQHPTWSPDGTRIAFDADTDGDGWNELALMNADGTNLHPIYDANEQNHDIWMGGWMPNGRGIVVVDLGYVLYQGHIVQGRVLVYISLYDNVAPYQFNPPNGIAIDIQSADPYAPSSHVLPLPQYSRAAGFTVGWEGQDRGASGVVQTTVQTKIGPSTAWTDWQQPLYLPAPSIADVAPFVGAPGSVVSFRSRAEDDAGNLEAWPAGSGDTTTTLYSAELNGTVRDARGQPIPRIPVQVTPALLNTPQTDADGRYRGYAQNDGSRAIGVQAAGYGQLPAATRPMTPDQALALVLPPSDNLIQNGTFEAGNQPVGWTAQGSLPTTITTVQAHTGSRALATGQNCAAPCLDPAVTHAGQWSSIVIDQQGTTHLAWTGADPNGSEGAAFYSYRIRGQGWSTPLLILSRAAFPQLTVDGLGTVHVVVRDLGGVLQYLQLPRGGVWSAPVNLKSGGQHYVASDAQGRLHMIYTCDPPTCADARAYYRERTPTGVWTQPAPFFQTTASFDQGSLVMGPDGSLYVAWASLSQNSPGVFLAIRHPDGSWTTPEAVTRDQASSPQLGLDALGTIHLLWSLPIPPYGPYYTYRRQGEPWVPIERLALPRIGGVMVVDRDGTAHLVQGGQVGAYYRKAPNQPWSAGVAVTNSLVNGLALATDGAGQLTLVWSDGGTSYTRSSTLAAASSSTTISQTVSIPAQMHAPTLSFVYQLRGVSAANGSQLSVAVSNGIAAQTVLSTTATTDWQQSWIDLQPWAGQTVNIAFTLQQAKDAPIASLVLDDVSLGSWLTPVIQQISPAAIVTPAQPTQITITGANFIATPSIKLGTTALTNVVWIDEHTLHATLPAGTKPGRYDVRVTNPGGQAAVLPRVLVGVERFLPLTIR